jgi:quercetin dioxygenase-like cupin family protein
VLKKSLIVAAAVVPVVVVSAIAQQSAIKRTPLQTVDFPAGYNVVSAIAEVPAGSCAGRHSHPGIESSYVMEGPMVVKIEGKPDQTFKTGDSFQIPVNAVHDAWGVGGQGFKVLGTDIVEKVFGGLMRPAQGLSGMATVGRASDCSVSALEPERSQGNPQDR